MVNKKRLVIILLVIAVLFFVGSVFVNSSFAQVNVFKMGNPSSGSNGGGNIGLVLEGPSEVTDE